MNGNKSMRMWLFIALLVPSTLVFSAECVVLLHGMARSSSSMEELEEKLVAEGYYVANIDYPSTQYNIAKLAELAVGEGVERCRKNEASPINFVTHSLGGILVRQYYTIHDPASVRRVVMLAPPNQGSEVVDGLKELPGYELMNGPAGMQLGTGVDDVPKSLGAVNFELGVVAGTRTVNLILSTYLPNPNDGKVSVESTKVEGMCGFVSIPATHTFLMTNNKVIDEVIYFLAHGKFKDKLAQSYCGDQKDHSDQIKRADEHSQE